MSLEENHKGCLSPFPFSQCHLLGSSEAPNRVTSKVKCNGLPFTYACCWGLLLSHPLGALSFLKGQHFYKQVLEIL